MLVLGGAAAAHPEGARAGARTARRLSSAPPRLFPALLPAPLLPPPRGVRALARARSPALAATPC